MQMKKYIPKRMEIAAGFMLMCLGIALLMIESKKGNIPSSIIAGGTSWLGYITAHKTDTGKLIDTTEVIEENIKQKDSEAEKWKSLIGIVLFTAGSAVIVAGLRPENYILTFIGSTTTMTGYAVFHYFMEGKMF